ncbi:MAG: tetratricopeptide repeat protein [Phycisphaerales bacterium]|nr:MAG: tetratricopeptide repeat protein [Phycisphaerales bacterium]
MKQPKTPTVEDRCTGPNRRVRTLLLALVVVVVGIGAYSTSFNGTFMFDEIGRIVNNDQIHGMWPLSRMLPGRRPVVTFTLALNHAISGLDIWSYHLLNLVVHLLAGLTLYGIVRRALVVPKYARRFRDSAPWIASCVALIWTVHPLQTQSVTYIIQRGESLMGLFYLLTLYCTIRASDSHVRTLWYIAAIASCALGMGSKEVMVTAPFLAVLFDVLIVAPSVRVALRERWPLYTGLAATWLLLIPLGILHGVLDSTSSADNVGFGFKGITPLEYALTQPGVVLHYLRLALWPSGLCLDYGWPVAKELAAIIPSLLAVGALFAGTLWCVHRKPWLGFLGAWFFVILAPTSSIVPIKDPAFEHRMYLPLAAVVILVVFAGHHILRALLTRLGSTPRARYWTAAGLMVVVTAGLGYATAQRNKVYHSRLSMWSDVVAKRPDHARGHCNLGVALLDDGQVAKAIESCRRSVTLDPTFASGHYRLAKALKRNGRIDEAIQAFLRAIEIDAGFADARFDLGNTFYENGMFDEAIREYQAAVKIDPGYTNAQVNLGNVLGRVGRTSEAVAAYREALRTERTSLEGRYNLAVTLARQGAFDDAAGQLRTLLRFHPSYAPGHATLGGVLLRRGRLEAAADALRQALRLDPRNVGAHFNLGAALEGLGRFREAAQEFQIVLQLQPDSADAQRALEAVQARLVRQGSPNSN